MLPENESCKVMLYLIFKSAGITGMNGLKSLIPIRIKPLSTDHKRERINLHDVVFKSSFRDHQWCTVTAKFRAIKSIA